MKVIYMGTPDFAVGALESIIEAGHEVVLVVTQPDKPKGRSKELQAPPVKECALRHDIPVFQPARVKTPESIAVLREYEADVFVVAAFGQILSQEILDMPEYGCLCVHASLLPKYRGASPIQHVILDGEEKTGVTIMQMDAGIDTGDMLYKKEIEIERTDTSQTLHDKLMVIGGEAITEALELLEDGCLEPQPQQDELSCYAPIITKEMGKIDFTKDAYSIELQVRGLNPWPSAFTVYRGKQLKIWEAVAQDSEDLKDGNADGLQCGSILKVQKDHVVISTGKGILKIYSLQLEGKKRMSTHDFLLGVKMQVGETLGV